jgi:hypothetical protein
MKTCEGCSIFAPDTDATCPNCGATMSLLLNPNQIPTACTDAKHRILETDITARPFGSELCLLALCPYKISRKRIRLVLRRNLHPTERQADLYRSTLLPTGKPYF